RSYSIDMVCDSTRSLCPDTASRQLPLQSDALPYEPRQPLRPAVTRHDAQLHLGLAEPGVLTGQTQGAGHRDLASTAQGKAIDAGNHRFAEILHQVEHRLSTMCVFLRGDRVVFRQFS